MIGQPHEIQPCGHAVPIDLAADVITVTADHIGVVVSAGDHYGATEISIHLNLPTPVGAACVRLDGKQYTHLRDTLNALSGLTADQIAALDAQLHPTQTTRPGEPT